MHSDLNSHILSSLSLSPTDDEDDSYDNPKPLHLSLVDFSGLCILSIPSRWIDLDKPVTAKVTLRDYTVPVVSMHLLLLRTEYIHDVSTDIIWLNNLCSCCLWGLCYTYTDKELMDLIPHDPHKNAIRHFFHIFSSSH